MPFVAVAEHSVNTGYPCAAQVAAQALYVNPSMGNVEATSGFGDCAVVVAGAYCYLATVGAGFPLDHVALLVKCFKECDQAEDALPTPRLGVGLAAFAALRLTRSVPDWL